MPTTTGIQRLQKINLTKNKKWNLICIFFFCDFRAIRLTGPFVTMIYSMITGDMLTFGIIYSVFLFGFSQSFFFLYKGSKNVSSSLFTSYPSTWMALFQVTMGDYNVSLF